jgi:outer membrane protein insertion porin family
MWWAAVVLGLGLGAAVAGPAAAQSGSLVVRQLKFEGNDGIDDLTLAAAISTTNSSAFARLWFLRWTGLGEKRYFDETQFQRDVLRLGVVYKRSGYPDATIDTIVRRTPHDIYITFRIHEGEPVRLRHIIVDGIDSVKDSWRLRQDLPIHAGNVASNYKLHDTADTIALRLRNQGYPTATVEVDPDFRTDTTYLHSDTARLVAHTGTYATFGQIHVQGSTALDSSLIASLLAARPGNQYRLNDIFRSQQELYRTDLFRFASVQIDTTDFHEGDPRVPLEVDVVDNFGHQAKASVGLATDDCFRTSLGWTARNFPGQGLVFDVSGRLSKIGVGSPLGFGLEHNLCSTLKADSIGSREANYGLNASIRRNAFLSPDNTVLFSVFGERRSEFEVYLRKEIGASVTLTRVTAADVPISISYQLVNGTTSANPASFCAFFNTCEPSAIQQLQQRRFQGTVTFTVQRQRANNYLDPSRGSLLSFSATTSSKWLGSSASQQFTRFVGDASGYLPVMRTMVLAGHLRAGVIFAPQVSVSGGAGNFVPPDQRFYAGGANDVRGYDQNELGPVVYVVPADSVVGGVPPASATRVAATGGTRVAIGNLELRLPYFSILAEQMRFVLFVDAGSLWNTTAITPLRVTPGAGLRVSSPIGPIRFDIGYNPYRHLQAGALYTISPDGSLALLQTGYVKDRSNRFTLHISVGQAF